MTTQKRHPAYVRISDEIAAEIASGALLENEQLPTERDMCDKYGVSRITVRHALALLEQQGMIRKRQGQGIFVCPRKYEQSLDALYHFDTVFTGIGVPHERKILDMEQRAVSGDIAGRLGVFDRSVCTVITSICSVEGKPYMHQVSYVPQQLLAGAEPDELCRTGICNWIGQRSGLVPDRAVERYEAMLAPGEVMGALGRRAPLAVLKLERVTVSGSRPIEYMVSHLAGDKIAFRLMLK